MKKQSFLLIALVLISLVLIHCDKDNTTAEVPNSEPISTICDTLVIVNEQNFNAANSEQLSINSYEIDEHCLKINFSSSGCDGSSWKLNLLGNETVLYSNPPQRLLKFDFENIELCEAYITKEKSFDLRELQVDGGQVILQVEHIDQTILYEY